MGLSSRFDRFKRKLKKQDGVKLVASSSPGPGLTSAPHVPRSEVEPLVPTVTVESNSASIEASTGDLQRLDSTLSGRLWTQAYDDLRVEDASLVEGYERVLAQLEDEIRAPAAADAVQQDERQIKMKRLLKAGLEKTEKEAKLWAGAGAAMDFVLSAKEVIDAAVQAAPQAALAWTGVSIALQVSDHKT
jgi:hypothetical protein